jgi:6-phosphogluconolactonase
VTDDGTTALLESTGAEPEVVVHGDAPTLALVTAGRLVAALLDAQSARGSANLVLTGGGIGLALLASLATHPARDAVTWSAVDIWWGDERWVPARDAERNDEAAWEALLGRVALDPDRIHRMGASDGELSIDAASAGYSSALAQAGEPDVLLLGVGPEGHIASLFPRSPALAERSRLAAPVRSSPKPPSSRITMTLPAIRRARQVWLLAAGNSKADAVAKALGGTPERDCPAAGARGTARTLWLVDKAATAAL